MKKMIFLAIAILMASCISIPGPENENSILLVVNAKFDNAYPDLYCHCQIYMDTNLKKRIKLNNGSVTVIGGLNAGALIIRDVYIECDVGLISRLSVNKSFVTEKATIYIMDEKYDLGSNSGTGSNQNPRVWKLSQIEVNNIITILKDTDNYDAWQNGHEVLSGNH